MANANGMLAMDLAGRLRNVSLPVYRALIPLFEAIINSVHAIEEKGNGKGRIDVEILRGGQRNLGVEAGKPREEITGFRISDNGVGFTETNYSSFCTADSRHKLEIGGRGVGRLTWLKAYRRVRLRSVYRASDGALWCREFPFTKEDGVAPNEPAKLEGPGEEGTVVLLDDVKSEFKKAIPKTLATIGERVVDHFLVSLRPNIARVLIHDGGESFDVTSEVATILATAAQCTVQIGNETFKLTHVKVTAPEVRNHRIAYLGNGREVRTENLATHMAQLKGRISDGEDNSFWSLTMVEADLLDSSLTMDRGAFTLPDSDDEMYPDQWTLQKIRAGVLPKIKEQLDPFLEPIREKARDQVRKYIEEQAPEYRAVMKFRPSLIEELPTDLSPEKLDSELRKFAFRMEMEIRQEGHRLLEEGVTDPVAYQKYVEEVNETAVSNLAKYVIQRRVILNLFRKALKLKADGKYELESAVHKIIFPLAKDSDDVPFEQTNLWILDEKLAYHAYLASDKQLRTLKNMVTDSQQRPDLIVFNRPHAFVDGTPPYESVVIVEFKRPARDDYDDKENPFTQIYRYVNDVRAGGVKDHEGRPIKLGRDVPFFAYVVCDMTPKLQEMATFAQLRPTWDGQGFFGFNENLCVYVEVTGFDKLLADAERRNRVFFDKLRLK